MHVSKCLSVGLPIMIVGLFAGPAGAAGADAPPKPVELKVLQRLIGTWNSETWTMPAEWTPKEVHATGTLVREWILDGQFVQETAQHSDGNKDLVIFGWDAQRASYRAWHFNSGGWTGNNPGQWDAAAKKLTFNSGEIDGKTTIATIQFISDDVHEWKATTTDKAGKVYFNGGGKCTRKK